MDRGALGKVRAGSQIGGTWLGLSPEGAAQERARINTAYGLWFVLVLGATIALAYLVGSGEKKEPEATALEPQEDPQEARKREIAKLKARLNELEEEDGVV